MVNTEPPESASLPSPPDATSPIHLRSEPKLRGDHWSNRKKGCRNL